MIKTEKKHKRKLKDMGENRRDGGYFRIKTTI